MDCSGDYMGKGALYLFNQLLHHEQDATLIFKRCTLGLISEFYFYSDCLIKANKTSQRKTIYPMLEVEQMS